MMQDFEIKDAGDAKRTLRKDTGRGVPVEIRRRKL